GVVLGAAAAGGVVVLDGLATAVAALLATQLEPAVAAHLVAGQRSRGAGPPTLLAPLRLPPILRPPLPAARGARAGVVRARAGRRLAHPDRGGPGDREPRLGSLAGIGFVPGGAQAPVGVDRALFAEHDLVDLLADRQLHVVALGERQGGPGRADSLGDHLH